MYSKADLMNHMAEMGINPTGTLLVHSSMKAIGEVEGRADTVLDALMEYMKDGLLVLPTHTWSAIGRDNPVFYVKEEPSCVGILTNLFRKRPGVVRSLHPTHSVAAFGRDAEEYVCGEEFTTSPCDPRGCWGKLYKRGAQILMLGCGLNRYTFLHCVEEMNNIPNRLSDKATVLYSVDCQGNKHMVLQNRHQGANSENYIKMEPVFIRHGAMKYGRFGDARCMLCDAVKTADVTAEYLKRDWNLLGNADPVRE